MAPLGENFRGKDEFKICPLCSLHLDNQSLVFQCEVLKREMDIECKLEDLYTDNIKLQTAITITKIEEVREQITKPKKNENVCMLPSGPCAQYCAQCTVHSVSAAKTATLS